MNMLIDFLHNHYMTAALFVGAMSIITFFLFGIDKLKAKRGSYRIPEKVLIGFSFFFGAIGGVLGMYFFHHKTRKAKFYVSVPLFAALQIILLVLIMRNA